MLEFLFGKKQPETENKSEKLNKIYSKLKEKYSFNSIPDKRKEELKDIINLYGYLNYPYIKALEELTPAEILFGLEIKWKKNGIFKDGKFHFNNDEVSVLARNGVKNSDW